VPDLGSPSSYLTLAPGLEVYSRDGEKLGEIQYVLAEPELDVFDGVVIDASVLPGELRFADAADIAEIYERGIVLGLDAAGAGRLPEPAENPGSLEVHGVEDVDRSELREKLRRAWQAISGEGLDKS